MAMHTDRKGIAATAIAMMILGILMPGCRRAVSPDRDADSVCIDPVGEPEQCSRDAEAWADSVMSGMTLEQMAGQLVLPAVYSDDSRLAMRSVVAYVADSHIGGVVLLKGQPGAALAIADTLAALSCAPPLVAIDAEWGLAMRLSDTPLFPKNGKISPEAEDSLLYEYGMEVARECREVGINMVLGPVLDVLPEKRNGKTFIGNRSFGSDAERVARLGVSYARGLEDGGVVSVAKHFPGHGAADADSHKVLPSVAKSLRQLEECDIMPFARYMEANLSGIMIGHLYVPALEEASIPVSVSRKVLKGVLRDQMGFEGLVITDAMNMAGAGGKTGADAIMAGADIVLAPADTRREVEMLVAAVRNGTFPLDQLRERVRRVLIYKYAFTGRESKRLEDKSGQIQAALKK